MPSLAVINFSLLPVGEVQSVVRAVNRQIVDDFFPVWGAQYTLRLDEPSFEPPQNLEALDDEDPEPVRADAVIYLVDTPTLPGALGYHSLNSVELPVGFVFTDLIPDWSVTLSHEVLEMIVDPTINVFAPGPSPDPRHGGRLVFHAYEVCDAVEVYSYAVDGVRVSDFVSPWYFSEGEGQGTRNDFLGLDLLSFGVLPGCHVQFFDTDAGSFVTYDAVHNERSLPINTRHKRIAAADCAEQLAVGARRPTDAALASELRAFNDATKTCHRVRPLPEATFRISRSARRGLPPRRTALSGEAPVAFARNGRLFLNR